MNKAKLNKTEAVDKDVYEVQKCFDSMGLSESCNNLYEAGMKNFKLCLLY